MKHLKLTTAKITIFILSLAILSACDNFNKEYYDNVPPNPPNNVRAYAGDNEVEIDWDYNTEQDVAGYNVYYSDSYYGKYTLLGNTENNSYIDFDAENGVKYYYGVAAYDVNGNESELSYDEAYGVARPEGMNQTIFDYINYPDISGYDFSEYLVTAFDASTVNNSADMFFENYNDTFYVDVWDDTDIQDMGPTTDILDVVEAPIDGWIPKQDGENIKYAEAIVGHTYVVWTWDNHFAKFRIKSITPERMVFDWAYQLMEGEPQLKTSARGIGKRGKLPKNVFRNK